MIAYFRFALVAVVLLGIACVSAIITMQLSVHRSIVTIPDLQGLPVEAATSQAAALGLDVSVTQRFYSTVLPAGRVLLQSPAPGASVRRGWDLAVAESLGPRHISIPDVLGKSEREAILAIRQKGLDLGAIAHLPDDRVMAGTVLAQDPGPEARGAEQPSISLLVAAPQLPMAPTFVMPDETGRASADASAELEKAGLHPQSAPGAPAGAQVMLSPATLPGTVVAQVPPAGSPVSASTAIVLSVTAPN